MYLVIHTDLVPKGRWGYELQREAVEGNGPRGEIPHHAEQPCGDTDGNKMCSEQHGGGTVWSSEHFSEAFFFSFQ